MDAVTRDRLRMLDNAFYRTHHASFSMTRQAPWPGWAMCLDWLETHGGRLGSDDAGVSVLDLACGNLRFERFLRERYPSSGMSLYAVDNCAALVPPADGTRFIDLDVLAMLSGETMSADWTGIPPCDLVVTFGFMHHVPSMMARGQVLDMLADKTRAGGHLIASFWRFADDDQMRLRAETSTMAALEKTGPLDLEEGDYLLGWDNEIDALRYCHSFGEGELEQLSAALQEKMETVHRVDADGRNGRLNTYLLFRRR